MNLDRNQVSQFVIAKLLIDRILWIVIAKFEL